MLDSLRNFATTLPGKLLGALLLIGMAGFGITGVITSIGSNTIARVGDRDIGTREFQVAYQQQINIAASQLGSVPTAQQAISLGIPGIVLNQLATNAALNILSDQMGLGVSNERLAESLRNDPSFAGTLGTFDRAVFEQVLRRNGLTENAFLKERREAAKRQQIALALFSRVHVPDAVKTILARFGGDRRSFEYVVLDEQGLLPVGDPGDETLQAYLEKNQSRYRTRETRKVDAMLLSPEILAAKEEVSEQDIAAEYEATKQNLFTVERRTIVQAPLPDDAAATAFRQGLADGKSFDELTSELGLSVSEIGTFSRAEMTDQRLAQDAFFLEENTPDIISSVLGKRVIMVTKIEPATQLSLEQAHDQLARSIARKRGRDRYETILDQIEEERAAFIELSKTAEEFGLDLVQAGVTQQGSELIDPLGVSADEAAKIATAIFNAEPDRLAPSVPLGANKTAWFELKGIEPARDQTLDEVRQAVLDDWTAEQRAQALKDKAQELLDKLKQGQSLTDLAVAQGLFPQIASDIGRSSGAANAIDTQVTQIAFQGGVGYTDMARNANGQYVVFKVTGITPASEPLSDNDLATVQTGYRDNIFSDFAGALRQDTPMTINQGLLSQVLGLGLDGSAGTGH